MEFSLKRTMPLEDALEREIAIVTSDLHRATRQLAAAGETERRSIRRLVELQEIYERLYGVEAPLPADVFRSAR